MGEFPTGQEQQWIVCLVSGISLKKATKVSACSQKQLTGNEDEEAAKVREKGIASRTGKQKVAAILCHVYLLYIYEQKSQRPQWRSVNNKLRGREIYQANRNRTSVVRVYSIRRENKRI